MMTRLNCDVKSCANNSSGCCCRPEINVSGCNADKCSETCCSSFLKEGSGATDFVACHEPNLSCDVHCNAKNCIHYKDNKCCADEIMVDGTSAECKKDTKCSTFSFR